MISLSISHPINMPKCTWKAQTQEHVTPPPYKIHGNSINITKIPKLSCVADLKGKFSQTTYFLPRLMEEDGKTREKQFIIQNEGTSTFGIEHCELIFFP